MKRLAILAILVAACSGPPGGSILAPTADLNDVETPSPASAAPYVGVVSSAIPSAPPTATPVPSRPTDAQLQARLNALRAANDCAGIAALDVEGAGDDVAADYADAVDTCSLVGVVYPTAKPATTVTIKGTGSRNTKPFSLGVAAFSVVVKGSGPRGNVAVTLYTVSGEYVELLVNEISNGGSYKYETAVYDQGCSSLEPCYYLDTTMPAAPWSVTFIPLP